MSQAHQFKLGPREKLVQCPYNPSHFVTNSRLGLHLQKCRRVYVMEHPDQAELPVEVCKYNWVHHVPAYELLSHQERCPDRNNQYSVELLRMEKTAKKIAEKNKEHPKVDEETDEVGGALFKKCEEWSTDSGPYDPKSNDFSTFYRFPADVNLTKKEKAAHRTQIKQSYENYHQERYGLCGQDLSHLGAAALPTGIESTAGVPNEMRRELPRVFNQQRIVRLLPIDEADDAKAEKIKNLGPEIRNKLTPEEIKALSIIDIDDYFETSDLSKSISTKEDDKSGETSGNLGDVDTDTSRDCD